MLRAGVMLCVAGMMLACAGVDNDGKKGGKVSVLEDRPPVMEATVTADTLGQLFLDNEIAADERYKGKWVRMTGTVGSIEKGEGGEATIYFNAPMRPRTKLLASEFSKAGELRPWSQVTVEGKCMGADPLIPTLVNCRIVTPAK